MKFRTGLIWLLVFGLALAFFACRENDSDETTPVTEGTPPPDACENNDPPTLAKAVFFIDGQASGSSATFMETETVDIFLAFDDAQCNLQGGKIQYAADGADPDTQAIDADAPCDGTAADQLLGFSFSGMGEGEHVLTVTLVDRCGAESDTVELTYTLTTYEPPADDDDNDDSAEPMKLTGEIRYYGEAIDYTGRPVVVGLYKDWLPGETLPEAYASFTVPETGFPFTYEWDLDAAEVVPADYYVFGYLDAVAEDGLFNREVDPAAAPFYAITVTAGATTTWQVNLVAPQK